MIAEDCAEGIMEARLYNRAIQFHKLMDGAPLRHFPLAFILIIPETQSFSTVVWSPKACKQRHNWYFCCSCSQGWCITKILHLFGSCLAQIWQGAHRYFSAFQLTCLDMVDIVFGLVRAAWKKNWFFISSLFIQGSHGCLHMMLSVMPNICHTAQLQWTHVLRDIQDFLWDFLRKQGGSSYLTATSCHYNSAD